MCRLDDESQVHAKFFDKCRELLYAQYANEARTKYSAQPLTFDVLEEHIFKKLTILRKGLWDDEHTTAIPLYHALWAFNLENEFSRGRLIIEENYYRGGFNMGFLYQRKFRFGQNRGGAYNQRGVIKRDYGICLMDFISE